MSDQEPRLWPRAVPPSNEPEETLERIVSRRRLKLEPGDIVMFHEPTGFGSPMRHVYCLRVHEGEALPERYTSFDNAAVRGEELAQRRRVRLFYVESEHQPPYLLKDARPPGR